MFFHLILEANVQNNQEKARVKQNKLIFHELKWPPLHLEIYIIRPQIFWLHGQNFISFLWEFMKSKINKQGLHLLGSISLHIEVPNNKRYQNNNRCCIC